MILSVLVLGWSAGFSRTSASEPGYWRQVRVEVGERPDLSHGPDYRFEFATSGPGACVADEWFRDATHLKARFSWNGPPGSLTPGEVIPISFKVEVLESKIGPGGFGASIDARATGQGWAFIDRPEWGSRGLGEVTNAQPPGTTIHQANKYHKAPAGAPGQTFTYEVFAKTFNTHWMYRYVYEWVGGAPPVASASDLSGAWSCSDGGTYVIQQSGNAIQWEARSADGGATWNHRFTGTLSGNLIRGHFKDSPTGRIHGEGDLVVRMVDPAHLEFVSCTVGFGGRHWTRK